MPEATAAAAPKKFVLQQYKTEVHVDWCPGCGDFGILSSIQQALYQLQIPPYKIAMISGIGCSGKTPHYIDTYGLHTLHGRALPVAGMATASAPDTSSTPAVATST
jgi:2-oxoglutarate ferredoxin oxidoreductase subunit beta